MTLARLARSAGVRLALTHAAIFAASVGILFAVVSWAITGYTMRELVNGIEDETAELAEEVRSEGLDAAAATIRARLVQVGAPDLAYLLLDAQGRKLAGNLDPAPAAPGWQDLRLPAAADPAGGGDVILTLGTRLPDGAMLLVGDDTHRVVALRELIMRAFAIAAVLAVVLALAGGVALGLRLQRRVEAVHLAAARIIDGNLGERIALSGAEDEFDRLARQLNRMLDRIQGLMEGLRQVSSDIAHDLRTPLARLRQRLDLARRQGGSVADYELAVDRAIEETDSILATFAALLRIAEIEAGTRRKGMVMADISEICERLREAFGAVAEDQGRTLVADIAPGIRIRGDPDQLTQMLANLIENALTHTPAGTTIRLALERSGPSLLASVADDGPGIPAAERPRVLDRFYRLDRSRSTPGSGLGLSLVAAVAELHGIGLSLEDNDPGLRVVMDLSALLPTAAGPACAVTDR